MAAAPAALRRMAPSPRPRWSGLIVSLAALVALSIFSARHSYPPLPAVLRLDVTFPRGEPGKTEPIVCTGMWGEGDLLIIRYLDEATAEFRYDHWGHGGPASPPFALAVGTPRKLRIEMPAFTSFSKPKPDSRAPLRVTLDGRELLGTDVRYHGRQPKQIFFGENSIGGSAAPAFLGTIRRPNGNMVRGGPESYFTTTEKLSSWLRAKPWHLSAVLVASLGLGFAVAWLVRWRLAHPPAVRPPRPPRAPVLVPAITPADARRRTQGSRCFIALTLVATIGYAWLVTLGSFDFIFPENFGSFYDYQAQSFLQGRLDVPEAAILGEAFEVHGKLYGYFGPTPALLRLPFVFFDLGFARLSRGFMLLYFVASLLAAYQLVRDATKLTRHGTLASPAEPTPFAITTLVASAGLGSTLFFLGSRGLIFHEAILAGIAFALWSAWCSLRHLHTPARRWWIGALVGGVLSLHCRPPTGLFALTLLGCVVVAAAWRDWCNRPESAERKNILPPNLWRHVGVGVLCIAGQLSLNGLAYLKFATFDPAPLRLSRPYADPARLAHIDGKSFHLVNVPHNFDSYVLRPNFRVEARFPWIYLGSNTPRRDFPHAKIDLPDHTLAVPYAMPSLFALATLGSLLAALTRPATRAGLAVLWAAVLPMTLALFAAIATAQRYTGDFCPFLICAAVFGLAAVEEIATRWRTVARSLTAFFTAASVAITLAITLQYQGAYLWGVPEEARVRYQNIRRSVDAFFGLPAPTPAPPPPPRTDVDR